MTTRRERPRRSAAGRTGNALRTVQRSVHDLGWRTSLRQTARRVEDRWFDVRHGVHTGGMIEIADLALDPERAEHACGYAATGHREFHQAMAMIPPVDGGAFLDVGCGKGRVLLMAAAYPFARIAGIEISAELVDEARANVARFGHGTDRQFDVACTDVRDMAFRGDERVVFLYNPFDEPLVAGIVDSLGRSIRTHPRTVHVLYANPRHRHVLDGAEGFTSVGNGTGGRVDVAVHRAGPAL